MNIILYYAIIIYIIKKCYIIIIYIIKEYYNFERLILIPILYKSTFISEERQINIK